MDKLPHKNSSYLPGINDGTLFRRWHEHGDRVAREKLVEAYLPMAHRLARRYRGAREPVGDLRQVAALGLLKAIDGYNVERGYNFPAYAVPSILGELRRYFRDCGWSVHVPRGLQELALKVEKAKQELATRHATVTAAMIAEYLEITVEDVSEALETQSAHHAMSFETPTGDGDEGPTIGHGIGFVDPEFNAAEARADIARASLVLDDRERSVLHFRFEDDMTQAEIGAQLGVSQMQVSRILKQALGRLTAEIVEPEDVAEPGTIAGSEAIAERAEDN